MPARPFGVSVVPPGLSRRHRPNRRLAMQWMGIATTATAGALMMAPPVASGSPPWTDPAVVATPRYASAQGVDFTDTGAALLHWTSSTASQGVETRIAWRDASGTVGPESVLPARLAA